MIPFIFGAHLLFSVARAEAIALIVNAQNPQSSVTRSQVSDFFLKKTRVWPDGVPVKFIDRKDGSSERREFLQSFIRKTPRDIELYWIGQKLYSGHSAPSQVATDAMTEMIVSRFPGAVGYVSKDFEPTRAVKKISVTGP